MYFIIMGGVLGVEFPGWLCNIVQLDVEEHNQDGVWRKQSDIACMDTSNVSLDMKAIIARE